MLFLCNGSTLVFLGEFLPDLFSNETRKQICNGNRECGARHCAEPHLLKCQNGRRTFSKGRRKNRCSACFCMCSACCSDGGPVIINCPWTCLIKLSSACREHATWAQNRATQCRRSPARVRPPNSTIGRKVEPGGGSWANRFGSRANATNSSRTKHSILQSHTIFHCRTIQRGINRVGDGSWRCDEVLQGLSWGALSVVAFRARRSYKNPLLRSSPISAGRFPDVVSKPPAGNSDGGARPSESDFHTKKQGPSSTWATHGGGGGVRHHPSVGCDQIHKCHSDCNRLTQRHVKKHTARPCCQGLHGNGNSAPQGERGQTTGN